ncbi:hypothetical protein KSP39_PZI001215 [Platanthera zijinensis]|uniref:Uncharacterized protein n=1 Tax=Platanthera zijinensis TaxID=2320716 RepID=A0AAP0C4F2_9ASPA
MILHFSIIIEKAQECCLLGHHEFDKLLVVDLSITINISFADHLINLLICQLLSKVCHDMAKLGSRDEPILILVKHPEGLLELLLRVCILHFAGHEVEEFWEVNCPIAICIHFINHVLQLRFSWILTQ